MTADLFSAARETLADRKRTLLAEAATIDQRMADLEAMRATVTARLDEITNIEEALEKAPPVEAAKPERAKPGEIETSVMRALQTNQHAMTPLALADFGGHKFDSVKAVLRRLVSLGELIEENGLYRLKPAEQLAAE